ncbi:MAG: hypothetical protein JW768_15870 [Chitinispirillaceae bacterium]|nr:hypothetical protein [Chitinispirillaceae bacterium]
MKRASSLAAVVLSFALFASASNFPFPQNRVNYGIRATTASSSDVQSVFDQWMRDYYEESGNEARIKWDDKSKTVSEGVAYGMLIMACMDNSQNNTRDEFDKLWAYYKRWRNDHGVMHWKINGFSNVEGQNGATDAELDAAVALILAHRQWGSEQYRTDAGELVGKIWQYEVNADKYIKPGDMWDTRKNPSYFCTGALELFKTIDSHDWDAVIRNSYALLKKVANSSTGLVPDWCSQDGNTLQGDFYYDAVRTPWRMAWAYAWYGHGDARDINAKMATWIRGATGNNPASIKAGYSLSGNALAGFSNATFTGCLSCAAMVSSSNQDFVNGGFAATKSADASSYYNKTLQVVTMLTLSGNLTPMNGTPVIMPRMVCAAPGSAAPSFIVSATPFTGSAFSLNGKRIKQKSIPLQGIVRIAK